MPKLTLEMIESEKGLKNTWMKYAEDHMFLNEYMFSCNDFDPKIQWTLYLNKKAKQQVNLPYQLMDKAEELAKTGDFSTATWGKLISACQAWVFKMVDPCIDDFSRSKEYINYCIDKAIPKYKKKFGIKNTATLHHLLTAYNSGKKAEALKYAELLIKQDKLKDVTAQDMLSGLEKF